MKDPFVERLEKGPILSDGAIGTQLYERGVPYGKSFDELNIVDPSLVSGVHIDYLRAGAEIITTNTFGANRIRLKEFGLEKKVRDINLRGVKIAREAREIVGVPAFIAGSVGPIGRPATEYNSLTDRVIGDTFREQIEALLEGGADVIMFETFSELEELLIAIEVAKEVCELPIIAQMSFGEDELTHGGDTPEDFVRTLKDSDVDVIGVNCSVGPQGTLDVVMRLIAAGAHRVSAQPNAGLPSRRGQHFVYISTPEYFAEYAKKFVSAGAVIVGGCCGTTPAHISAMAAAIKDGNRATTVTVNIEQKSPHITAIPSGEPEPTKLAQAIKRGEFIVSVEVDPPKGLSARKTLEGAKMLAEKGVKWINIGDSPMARVRMSCIALAKLIQETTPIEAIIHFTTRDRNVMAIQSDLIGAHAMGIRNVIALTGDPPSLGDYPDATGVWDIDSVGLIKALSRMNEGFDLAGKQIGAKAGFCIAAAVDPTAKDIEFQIDRMWQKIEAGAHLIMSQPLYDVEDLQKFLDRVGNIPVPFVLGVLPLQSYKHAEFMHNEVPGIYVPEHILDAMRRAGSNGLQEGVRLAQELVHQAQHLVQGIYLMPSFGRYDVCAQVFEALDIDKRPTASNSSEAQAANK